MRYILMFLTLVIGALMPVQAILNTRFGKQIGGPLMGSLMSFLSRIDLFIYFEFSIQIILLLFN